MKKRRFFIICICFIFHMKTGYFNKRFVSCFSIMKSRILLLIIKIFFIIMYVFLHAIFLFKQNMSLFFMHPFSQCRIENACFYNTCRCTPQKSEPSSVHDQRSSSDMSQSPRSFPYLPDTTSENYTNPAYA